MNGWDLAQAKLESRTGFLSWRMSEFDHGAIEFDLCENSDVCNAKGDYSIKVYTKSPYRCKGVASNSLARSKATNTRSFRSLHSIVRHENVQIFFFKKKRFYKVEILTSNA